MTQIVSTVVETGKTVVVKIAESILFPSDALASFWESIEKRCVTLTPIPEQRGLDSAANFIEGHPAFQEYLNPGEGE